MRTPIASAVLLVFAGLPLAARAQTSTAGGANSSAAIAPAATAATSSTVGSGTVSSSTANAASAEAPEATEAAAPVAASAAAPAIAQESPLAPVVVTAARTAQPLADAIPQTTVFDAQDIADSGAADVSSLLSLGAGAQVVRTGGPGAQASLSLRGAESDQTLVLIDGVRMESASLGAAQLSELMLDQIDHVEMVSGNVSALYGSNAIGGVVQIFTKDGGNHPPRFNVETEYGSYHTQRQTAGVNGALDASGDTTFSVSATRLKTDGFSAINPALAPGANPNANGFLNTSVSATLKHKFNASWDAGVSLYESTGNVSFDNAFGDSPTDLNNSDNHVREMSAFVDGKLNDRWTTHLRIGQSDDQATTTLNGAFSSRFNSRNQQLTWQNEFALAAGQKMVFGYERLNQSLDSDEYAPPERHVNSGFVGYEGRFGANQFQFNVRHDQYSDFGGQNSYYAGYGYNFNTHWKALASWADSFRAPTFNDLYFPDFGNPLLRPERSHSLEAALQYSSDQLGVMRLSAFQTRYTDLIVASQVLPGVFAAENVGRAKVQGLEGSWAGRLAGNDVRASFTLQNPVDEIADQDLDRRPRRFASFSTSRNIDGWRVGAQWLVVGARTDSGTPLAGYGVINLSARYNITKSWYVGARVDNLTNKNYELAYTYNTPGRGVYLTLGWQQQ